MNKELDSLLTQMSNESLPRNVNLDYSVMQQKINLNRAQKAPASWTIAASVVLVVLLAANSFAFRKVQKKTENNLLQKMELVNSYSIYDTNE